LKKFKIKILENNKDLRELITEDFGVADVRQALLSFMIQNGILEFTLKRKPDGTGKYSDSELVIRAK
tara:strand:- start:658 stop:858 length:201 start_codon:yes stop_codon:yes gene_type:complete